MRKLPMSDKPEIYWEGFADGQRDMEMQLAAEDEILEPNDFCEQIDNFSLWVMEQLVNNGSDELDEDGSPLFKHYGQATQAAFAAAFAYSRLLRIVSACIFKLNQGDFTEEQFHHELEHALNQLNNE